MTDSTTKTERSTPSPGRFDVECRVEDVLTAQQAAEMMQWLKKAGALAYRLRLGVADRRTGSEPADKHPGWVVGNQQTEQVEKGRGDLLDMLEIRQYVCQSMGCRHPEVHPSNRAPGQAPA